LKGGDNLMIGMRGPEAASLAGHQLQKRDVADYTAAQAVAVALLPSGMANTVTASGLRLRLQSSGNSSALLKMLRADLT
jgi:hypothetical protein